LGYELAYVRLIRTPTGRTIRFTTNRLIRFGEAYTNSQTMGLYPYCGEFDLDDADKDKSSAVLFPACQLIKLISTTRVSCCLNFATIPGSW
jgi:hypothetical protein